MKVLFDKIFDSTLRGLNKALDLGWKRNEAIVSNLANAETPQYRSLELNFAGELNRAFGDEEGEFLKTNSKHLDAAAQGNSHLVPDLSGVTKADGNNVDIDIQMGKLAFNSSQYSIATSLMRKKLQIISQAIRQGLQ